MQLLALEKAINNLEQIGRQLTAARRKAEVRRKQEEMRKRSEELEIAKLEQENGKTNQVVNQEKELARNGTRLRPTQSQKKAKQLQSCKGSQKWYRTFKASSTSTKPPAGSELSERSAHSQKGLNGMTDKVSRLRSNKELCFGRIASKIIVGSHWHSNHESVENSSSMTTAKQTRTRKTSCKERSSDRNESQKT